MRLIGELVADIDRLMSGRSSGEWLTLPEVIEHLGESWNRNPARTGRGLFRLNGQESFGQYASSMRAKLYTYPHVAAVLCGGRYPSVLGVRNNKEIGNVEVSCFGPIQ